MKCMRCGQTLKPEEYERGYDETCRVILNEAAKQVALDYSPSQVRKAAEALRNGSMNWIGDGIARFTSSDGERFYWTTRSSCTCPAGEAGVKCYHRAAYKIRALSPVA